MLGDIHAYYDAALDGFSADERAELLGWLDRLTLALRGLENAASATEA